MSAFQWEWEHKDRWISFDYSSNDILNNVYHSYNGTPQRVYFPTMDMNFTIEYERNKWFQQGRNSRREIRIKEPVSKSIERLTNCLKTR